MHITFNRKCSWKAATGAGGDAAQCEHFWLACVRPWFWSQGPSVKSRIQMWPTTPPHDSFFWLSGNLPSLSLSISPCSWRERGSEPIPTLIPLPPYHAPGFDPLFFWLTFSFEHSWPWRRADSLINGELTDPRAQFGHGHWCLLGPTLGAYGLYSFGFLEAQSCSILLASSVGIWHPDSHPPSQDCFSILDVYPSHDWLPSSGFFLVVAYTLCFCIYYT